jgi:hypothetical protein
VEKRLSVDSLSQNLSNLPCFETLLTTNLKTIEKRFFRFSITTNQNHHLEKANTELNHLSFWVQKLEQNFLAQKTTSWHSSRWRTKDM